MSPGRQLRDWLDLWPNLDYDFQPCGLIGRITDAVRDLPSNPDDVGEGDLFGLFWQLLRQETLTGRVDSTIRVPSDHPWPLAVSWSSRRFQVLHQGNQLRLTAKPWTAEWLSGPKRAIDLATVVPEDLQLEEADQRVPSRRRRFQGSDADPFFKEVFGVDPDEDLRYRSSAQREALRTVLTAPAGASVVVSLPTGSGKSSVALVPALVSGPQDLTLFIVPTTALALDQERALARYRPLRGSLSSPFAYHSGLTSSERQAFRERIATGEQRVVFTSPESAIGSLRRSIFKAAEAGHLRYLVIDEAHMVTEWGNEFRPEFQHLAGLRWDLLRLANQAPVGEPFRTLLLSATLTETAISTLHALFGGEDFQIVASITLRPEPFFLLGNLTSPEERFQRVGETAAYLPKPMVIYVTRPQDASALAHFLRGRGVRRVRTVTGDTPASQRLEVVHAWRGAGEGSKVDIVVANSAFGLGIDMDDIRSVVHACIPETFDRFYQEVGRGGRDGFASLSVLLPANSDFRTARSLSSPTLIGIEKASSRWSAMISHAEQIALRRYRVDLRVIPPGFTMTNEQHRAWNLRTLALMARAGLIRLQAERPPKLGPDATPDDWQEIEETFRNTVAVELLHGQLNDSTTWADAFEAVRTSTYGYFRTSFGRISKVVQGDCPTEHARETYRVVDLALDQRTDVDILPQGSCHGCPTHLFTHQPTSIDVPTETNLQTHLPISTTLRLMFGESSTLLVTFTDSSLTPELHPRFRRVARELLQHGILEFIDGAGVTAHEQFDTLHRFAPGGFVFWSRTLVPLRAITLPTAIFATVAFEVPTSLLYRPAHAPPCILFSPVGTPAPWKPSVSIERVYSPHWPFTDFEAQL